MKGNKSYFIAAAIFFTLYIFFNSGDILNALHESNKDSSFSAFFVPGSLWGAGLTAAAAVYIAVSFFVKQAGPKKVGIDTWYNTESSLENIIKKDPEFNLDNFLSSVEKTAEKLNSAWTENDMRSVRNLVSAGIQNRFRIQLELMKLEGMQNIMSDWFLRSLTVVSAETDSVYDTIHVEIHAFAKDLNVKRNLSKEEKARLLADVSQTDYYEVWSFIRKRGAVTKAKGILSGNCPNCGSDINDLGELNQCRHCKSVINSGEYDWVLAEITQKEEWGQPLQYFVSLPDGNDTVNRQIIEDRASYLFWRWVEASVKGSSAPLRRDAAKEFLKSQSKSQKYITDAAVGAVDLKELSEDNGKYRAKVKILWSASHSAGTAPEHQRNIFSLSIPKGLRKKAGLSENSCESCGAPLPESDSLKCSYCGGVLPAQVNDWLLESVEKTY